MPFHNAFMIATIRVSWYQYGTYHRLRDREAVLHTIHHTSLGVGLTVRVKMWWQRGNRTTYWLKDYSSLIESGPTKSTFLDDS